MRSKILFLFLVLNMFAATAQETAEEWMEVLKTAKTDSARGAVCRKISLKYYRVDMLKCKAYAEKSNNYFIKANNKEGQGLALQMLGFVEEALGNNTKALEIQKKSISLLEESKNYMAAMVSYSGASFCLEKEGKLDEALKLVIRSLEIIDEQNLPDKQRAKNLVDLARVYRESSQLEKSIEVYNEALKISLREEDHATSGVILMNMGNVYTQKEEYKKALEHHTKALKEANLCNCAGRKTMIWSNIGFANYHLENADAVMVAADSAEKELLDTLNLQSAADIVTLKGFAQQLKGNHKEAIRHLEKALRMIVANNFKEKMVTVSTALSKSYAATGDYEKLQSLLSTTLAARDSSYNHEMVRSIAEMEIQYETDIKEQKLADANAQNKLKEQHIGEIRIRNRWLKVMLAIGLALAGVVFWLLQKSRRTTKLLVVKNGELSELLEQKKLLLKEIHHRVKNNLQTVSSLLNLQTRASEDSEVKKAMVEGQARLKSISLLHQKLYQHDELTKIEMDSYINELADYIIKNFNIENKKIGFKANASEIVLDLDTAIPLGLILNELITNSIKHSFKDIDEGEIDITIEKINEKNQFELSVKNNGAGLPKDLDIEKLPNMGLRLVKSLSRQIHGSFEIVTSAHAHFVVKFTEAL